MHQCLISWGKQKAELQTKVLIILALIISHVFTLTSIFTIVSYSFQLLSHVVSLQHITVSLAFLQARCSDNSFICLNQSLTFEEQFCKIQDYESIKLFLLHFKYINLLPSDLPRVSDEKSNDNHIKNAFCVIFLKMSIQFFCPFFNQVVCLLV